MGVHVARFVYCVFYVVFPFYVMLDLQRSDVSWLTCVENASNLLESHNTQRCVSHTSKHHFLPISNDDTSVVFKLVHLAACLRRRLPGISLAATTL